MEETNIAAPPNEPVEGPGLLGWRSTGHYLLNARLIQILYLVISLPTVLLISFFVPPMQSIDESRHFVRACQIAQGAWLSEIDAATGRGGGVLPEAVGDFVRHWMNAEWLNSAERLSTVKARMHALEREAETQAPLTRRRFVEFPAAGIYSPSLYIPQTVGIALARIFSHKVYVWFYSARVTNAICAILLIWLALRAAPQHSLLLIVPAALPMSLSQIASVSSDASIIALTVLFLALCIRFVVMDNVLIRSGLVLCLFLLVLGKPVHLPLGLLLLMAHKRLGWGRAISFSLIALGIAGTFYVLWSYLVAPFVALAGETHGQNPAAQVRFILFQPISFIVVVFRTFKQDGIRILKEFVGLLGWEVLALPVWFYGAAVCMGAAVIGTIVANRKKVRAFNFILGALVGIGLAIAVLFAGYILWNPPGSPTIIRLQGRYFLPALAVIAVVAPPLCHFGRFSKAILTISSMGCLLVSAFLTVRILDRYYFPRSHLLGRNIHEFFPDAADQSCPAWLESRVNSWFEYVLTGRTAGSGEFRILVVTEEGTIIGESDPALTGADFPYVLLPGSSRRRLRVHVWCSDKLETARMWLISGKSACSFGPKLQLKQDSMPDA